MLKAAPNPVDIQDIQFKLRCRLKVFENTSNDAFSKHCSLVASASRFGLIFIGTNGASIQVVKLTTIEECKNDGDKDNYSRRTVSFPSTPTHLSVNCEHTILAVVLENGGCPSAIFYDVKSFWSEKLVQLAEVRLSSTPGTHVLVTCWNPSLSAVFTACKSDGSLGVYEIKGLGVEINEIPAASGATCFCWSPKGKQIAVGCRDGKIIQYKPDLKAVKVINAPPLKEPHTLVSLQWVSNFQFIGVFQATSLNGVASLIVVDAPKNGEPVFTNYDDICYSNGCTRPYQFFMILQQQWNILMVASSNSMEVGLLGNYGDSWIQWNLGDAARAELPLSSDRQDTLPVGCDLDVGITQPLRWGEATLPPPPLLILLSHFGVLCCFNIVNLREGIPSICSPPESIPDTSGLKEFVGKTSVVPLPEKKVPDKPSRTETSITPVEVVKPEMQKPQNIRVPTSQPLNLFGGQATLTPIIKNSIPATQPSQLPSFFQNKPIIAPTTAIPGFITSTPAPATTIPGFITSTLPVATTTPGFTVSTPAPATISTNVPKPPKAPPKEPEILDAVDSLKTDEETEYIFAQMVKEECIFLESEVKATLHRGRSLKIDLGNDEEKTAIVTDTRFLQEFFKEMSYICETQSAEVHVLKQNLLQSWAWYEEVKSRYAASQNESMVILLKAQPLDAVSEKQLDDIRHAHYYLESQIAQANRALDEQWEKFQDYCKKTNKMPIPTMEVIYQTMVKQNAIMNKQSYILKDIRSRVKTRSRPSLGPSLLRSFTSGADLSEEMDRLRLEPDDIYELHYENMIKRRNNLSPRKSDALKNFIKKKGYSRLAPVKPQLPASAVQASSEKFKQFAKLKSTASHKHPGIEPKKLDFAPSPPIKPEAESNIPIQGLEDFTVKFGATNFGKPVIAGSPKSAFVSTSLASISTSTKTVTNFKPVNFEFATTASSDVKSFPSFGTTVGTAQQPVITISTTAVSRAPEMGISKTTVPPITVSFKSSGIFSTPTSSPLAIFSSATTAPSTFNLSVSAKPSSVAPSSTTTAQPLNFSVSSKTTFSKGQSGDLFTFKSTAQAPPVSSSTTSAPPSLTSKPPPSTALTITKPSTTSNFSTSQFSITTKPLISPLAGPKTSSASVTEVNAAATIAQKAQTSTSIFNLGTPTITTKPSIFSNLETSTSKPFISAASTNEPLPFALTKTSQSSPVTSTASIFGSSSGATTSVFGTPASTSLVFPVATTSTSAFVSATTSSVFGVSSTSSVFATPTAVFGTTTASVSSTTSSFGGADSVNNSTATVFGGTSTSTPSIFASFGTTTASISTTSSFASAASVSNSTATTAASVFGGTSTSTPSIFASFGTTTASISTTSSFASTASVSNSTATTAASVFGGASTSAPAAFETKATTSIFGAAASATTAFGVSPPVSTVSPQSIFANAPGATTAQSPAFGVSPPVSAVSPQSIFANAPGVTTAQSPGFGASPVVSTVQSIFGTSTGVTTAQSPGVSTIQSIFGNAPDATTVQSQGFGMFGAAPTNQQSIFGNSQPSGVFGAPNASTTQPFSQPKTTPAFGQTSSFGSTSAFGQSTGGSIFGSASTTTGSIFGGTPTTTSAFGSGSIFGAPAPSSESPFGSTAPQPSTGSFGFGSLNVGPSSTSGSSIFGTTASPNPFANANKSIFGSPATTSSSIFGASQSFGGQPAFGQPSSFPQGGFGNTTFGQQNPGPFSGGSAGTVAQTGFGGGAPQTGFGGFGSSPAFGSAPAFGTPPSFGGAPTFGGSPTKVFGSGTTGFGSGSQQNSGFGNLANQPTVGFGNLAQQAATPPTMNSGFSGSTSFSSWR